MSNRSFQTITVGYRWALVLKALLLLAISAGMALPVVGWLSDLQPNALLRSILHLLGAGFYAVISFFLINAAYLGFWDALSGLAVREHGAVALDSRASGQSLSLASGGFAEFILWNPWRPLTSGQLYTVTYGRHSHVLVRPPELEAEHVTQPEPMVAG